MSQASICIPTYNGAIFIDHALQSVINQTCRTFEIVVSDDDSTDGTLAHVERISDPRLRCVRNRQRLGLVGNWNRCIEIASHDLICLFHQDDEMLPNNIEKKIDFLDHNTEVGFVFSNMRSIDAEGAIIDGHWSPQYLPVSDVISQWERFLS
jgi:glycosyltransferase involved in cell wall biosynthesis